VKTGRNEFCPCGSGKKYKRCCLANEAPKGTSTATGNAVRSLNCITRAAPGSGVPDIHWNDDGLDDASNAVVDLIDAGRLEEAERAAHELLARYPGVPDGYDRLAMVFEARGDAKQAAHYYRQAVAFIEQHPTGFDDEALAYFSGQAKKLDPPSTGT
jgi:tetratricopeptide (TPR) repeat protein